MTVIKKLSLAKRIERVRTGYPAHDEFAPCAIRAFADVPMSAYMSGFGTEKQQLAQLLAMDDIDIIPYKDIAYMIYNLRDDPNNGKDADEAALLLAAPIIHFWNTRKEKNGIS